MPKSNLHALSQPEATTNDPLHDLIRQGARDLIARAVESELQGLLDQYADVLTPDGRKAVVRNGHLPKRSQFMLMWRLLAYYSLASAHRPRYEQRKTPSFCGLFCGEWTFDAKSEGSG